MWLLGRKTHEQQAGVGRDVLCLIMNQPTVRFKSKEIARIVSLSSGELSFSR